MEQNEKRNVSASQKGESETQQQLGRELHAALFPEEYDHIYDSASEAKDRQRGISPMNVEYVEKTNARRAQLGLTPFNEGPDAYNDATYAWVMEKLRMGDEAELREIFATRAREDLEVEQLQEQARQQLQPPAWVDQSVDDMLCGDKFLYRRHDRTDPYVIAFRVMGELFTLDPLGTIEPEFYRQLRRLLPDQSETEYHAMYQHALDEWTEAYGY